jgi:DNA replication protein DnaC
MHEHQFSPDSAAQAMATALRIEACKHNLRTRFTTCYGLVNELIEARQERALKRLMQKYVRCDLLV